MSFFLFFVVFVANAAEALTGFGSTILALTFASWLFPLEELLPLLVCLNVILSGYIVLRHPRYVATHILFRQILPASALGFAIGALLFYQLRSPLLKTLYGAFVLALSSYELARMGQAKRQQDKPHPLRKLWLIGGGFMQGLYASGGPLIVYYASLKVQDKKVFRSTLSLLWLILNTLLLLGYASFGRLSLETVTYTVSLVPALFLGIVLGEYGHRRASTTQFRLMVFSLLAVGGAALIFAQ